jgi:hypothetical protein
LIQRVIDQAERRVLKGETVPANEKLVSLFEPHTDIRLAGYGDCHVNRIYTKIAVTRRWSPSEFSMA